MAERGLSNSIRGRDLAALAVVLSVLGVSTPCSAGTTYYSYDVHGRLQSVSVPSGSDQSVTAFTFDNAGNRTGVANSVADTTPPNQPTGLVATPQAFDRIRLNWNAVLDVGGGPVANYKVRRDGSVVGSPGASPYDDQPLIPNSSYNYTVSAVDPSGNESIPSAQAGATTPPGPDLIKPSTPGNLQAAVVSCTWVNLTWSPSTDMGGSGLAGYEIFRGGPNAIGTSTVASYSDQTAVSATTYDYTVKAYDNALNRSDPSNTAQAITPDCVAPSAPGTPTFTSITGTSATANWTAATDNVGVTGYRYSLNGGSIWTTLGNVLTTNLSGLSFGTQYTLLVQAKDAAGNWSTMNRPGFRRHLGAIIHGDVGGVNEREALHG